MWSLVRLAAALGEAGLPCPKQFNLPSFHFHINVLFVI
jgi:hypothetical protein